MPTPFEVVIYSRVSGGRQVKEGDGLNSQETRCREYAQNQGWKVLRVFKESAVSGGLLNRPAMNEMRDFLESQKSQIYVLVDDISRWARETQYHFALKQAIQESGGELVSLNQKLEDTPEGKFIETIYAANAELERSRNARQVRSRMRARILNGYWCFPAGIGYKYETVPGHGKLLVPDEPIATHIKEAFEAYASGRLASQTEVARYLGSCPGFPKAPSGKVHMQNVHKILQKPIYAGYLEKPNWGIHLHPGKHKPLISFETWQKIQKRLNNQAHAPARKDLDADFPLRGFVVCASCGTPYTACWSRGKMNVRYPYYLCRSKNCPDRKKSIRKDKLEREFEALLKDLRPTEDLFYMLKEMLEDLWEDRQERSKADSSLLQSELVAIERKVEQFLERIVETDNFTLLTTYENKVRKLEEEKVALNEKIKNCGRPLKSFDQTFEPAFRFLANPYKLWESDRLEDKRSVLKLVFAERLPYERNVGLRTPALSLPFCLIGQLKGSDYTMVELRGIEPLTS